MDELTILEINSKDNHNTLSSWLNALHLRCAERLKIYATAASGGMYWPSEDKDGKRKFNSEEVKNKSNKKSNHNNTEENSQKIPKPNKFKPCDGCGRTHLVRTKLIHVIIARINHGLKVRWEKN